MKNIIVILIIGVGGLKGGAQKGGAPKGGAPKGGAQDFALFSLSRHNFNSIFFLSGFFSWNFGGVFEERDPRVFRVLSCARDAFSPVGVPWGVPFSTEICMQEIVDGVRSEDSVRRCTRAWKLFFLLPRMFMFRPVRRGVWPRTKLEWRYNSSLAIGLHCCQRLRQFQGGSLPFCRRGRRDTKDDEAKRVERAMAWVQFGELSAARQARQALEGAVSCEAPAAPKTPGLHTTARELRTCTFEGPGLQNTTNFPREDPQKREERMKIVAREGKKERKFGRSGEEGGPGEGGLGEGRGVLGFCG